MGTPEQTVESWNEKDQEIVVSQPAGFLFDILLRAKVESAPEDVYAILTDPKAVDIFRNIKVLFHCSDQYSLSGVYLLN